jgi:hypothetical protein
MAWKTFLKAHWSSLAAADFFTTEVWTSRGLVTFYTLFVIDLTTRAVHIAGTTASPDTAFVKQIARNLTDVVDGFLNAKRLLILDRDSMFSPSASDTRRVLRLLPSLANTPRAREGRARSSRDGAVCDRPSTLRRNGRWSAPSLHAQGCLTGRRTACSCRPTLRPLATHRHRIYSAAARYTDAIGSSSRAERRLHHGVRRG